MHSAQNQNNTGRGQDTHSKTLRQRSIRRESQELQGVRIKKVEAVVEGTRNLEW